MGQSGMLECSELHWERAMPSDTQDWEWIAEVQWVGGKAWDNFWECLH